VIERLEGMRILAQAVIGLALLQSPLTAGQALQAATQQQPSTKPALPSAWKSQTTGNEYRIRIEGDTFQAEWTNAPPELEKHKAYVRTECRRVGSKWIGTTRSLLPCTTGANANKVLNWCPLVTRTEIDSIAPDRITGRAQAIHNSDCQSCKVLEAVWKDFVWTPKR